MKIVNFFLASVFLCCISYATEVFKMEGEGTKVHYSARGNNTRSDELRLDFSNKNKKNIMEDRTYIKDRIKHYDSLIKGLESGENSSEMMKIHYIDYKKDFENLLEDFNKNPEIDIMEKIYLINKKHNMFSNN